MKNLLLLGLISLLVLGLSSCITIEEHYAINKNGSGEMIFRIDMSEMAPLLKMAQEMGDEKENQELPMDELNLNSFALSLRGVAGISDIQTREDKENLKMEFSCKFQDLASLNRALNTIYSKGETPGTHEFFVKEGKALTRNHMSGFDFSEILGEMDEGEEAMGMFMENMKYKIFFKTKKPIKVVYSGSQVSYLDKKHKEVELTSSFGELGEDLSIMNTTIVTK